MDADSFDVTVTQAVFFNEARDDLSGWFGGLQAGYNFMMTPNFLVGVEGDFAWSGMKGSGWAEERWDRVYEATDIVLAVPPGFEFGDVVGFEEFNIRSDFRTKVDWFGTFRARLGVPMDAVLPYITGGLAWGRVSSSGAVVATGEGEVFATDNTAGFAEGDLIAAWGPEVLASGAFSRRDTRVGWSLGAGIEAGLTENVSVKAEYLYVDLGSKSHTFALGNDVFTHRDRVNFHTVKVGLNWRFATGGMGVAY